LASGSLAHIGPEVFQFEKNFLKNFSWQK